MLAHSAGPTSKRLLDMAYMRIQAQITENYSKMSAHNKSKDKELKQYMEAALRGPTKKL